MTKYMLIMGGADLDKRSGNAAIGPAMLEQYMTWLRSLDEKGQLVSCQKLRDQTGARLSIRGGEIVEGPFVETKEAVGGILMIHASSLEEATGIARQCPVLRLQNGYVEVRVCEEPRFEPR